MKNYFFVAFTILLGFGAGYFAHRPDIAGYIAHDPGETAELIREALEDNL